MSTTPLALAITRNTPAGAVAVAGKKISVHPKQAIGSLSVTASGGTGATTVRVKESPLWHVGTVSGANLNVEHPPFQGQTGRYVLEATDSATPNPNKVEAWVDIETIPHTGWEVIENPHGQDIIIETAKWSKVFYADLTGRLRDSETTTHLAPRLTINILKHVEDGRILVYGRGRYKTNKRTETPKWRPFGNKPLPPDATDDEVCAVLRRGLVRAYGVEADFTNIYPPGVDSLEYYYAHVKASLPPWFA